MVNYKCNSSAGLIVGGTKTKPGGKRFCFVLTMDIINSKYFYPLPPIPQGVASYENVPLNEIKFNSIISFI